MLEMRVRIMARSVAERRGAGKGQARFDMRTTWG